MTASSYIRGDATLLSLARAFADAGDLRAIDTLLRDLNLTSPRRPIPESFFIVILRCYSRLRLPSHALHLFDRMLPDFHCRPGIRSFNTTLNALVSSTRFSTAIDFHSRSFKERFISPNLLTFNLLLKCHSRLSTPDEAIAFFRHFAHVHRCRFVPDAFSYATVMDALVRARRIDEAVMLLDEMSVDGCSLTEVNFNIVIRGLCSIGDLSRAGKLVKHMVLKGCVPNQVTYNTIIHGLSLKGKLESAMDIVECMIKKGCYPNGVTYGAIVHGMVKAGRLVDVEKVVKLMEESENMAPGPFVYSMLMSALFSSGRSDDALKLWTIMIDEKGVKPNTVLYTCLINGLCQAGKMEEAEKAFRKMTEDADCQPNTFTYSSMIRGYFKAGRADKATASWKDMIAVGCEPSQISYSILITGLCEEGRVREGMMVWRQMMTKECAPDVVAYSSIIKGLCDAGRVVEGMRFFYDMVARVGVAPDTVTYNILFTGLCKTGEVASAMGLLGKMIEGGTKKDGCDPDEVTCNVFLSALGGGERGREFLDGLVMRLCKRGRVHGAVTIMTVMLQRSYVPLASTWEKVVKVICSNSKVRRNIKSCWGRLGAVTEPVSAMS